jgi:hypothetical protein
MSDIEQVRQALATIEDFVKRAEGDSSCESDFDGPEVQGDSSQPQLTCTPKALPGRLLQRAAEYAVRINPVNAPGIGPLLALGETFTLDPQRIAVLTAKYWGPSARRLTVSFMESTASNLRNKIIAHMNAWSARCGISFVFTQGVGDVRISRGPGGYYSYLGTDIRLIPRNRQTMNLEGFSMSTPDSEYARVVRHETGHTLGFPHEHMRRELVARIDPQKAYEYFWRTQRWDRATVDQQVLTPLNVLSIFATPPDQTSIMCYQLPGSITRNGQPILGGTDINSTDYAFAALIYPRVGLAQAAEQLSMEVEEWSPEEDVEV